MRFKNRYLLLEFSFTSDNERTRALTSLTEKQLRHEIKEAILLLHGDYGLACVLHSLNVKYLNVTTNVAVLRVPRDHYRWVWSAISTMTTLQSVPCAINVIHIGGTIKSCQKKLISYNYQKLKAIIESTDSLVEKRKLKVKVLEVLKKDSVPLKV